MARFTSKKGKGKKTAAQKPPKPVPRPVPRPTRKRPPRKPWRDRVVELLAAGHTISAAAALAGVTRHAVYLAREKEKEFAEHFDAAMIASAEVLEAEARRRALEGVVDYVTHQGQIVMVGEDAHGNQVPAWHVVEGTIIPNHACVRSVPLVQRKYSDTLTIFLLKGRNPEVFGDRVKVQNDATPRSAAEGEAAAADLLARIQARCGIDPGRAAGG